MSHMTHSGGWAVVVAATRGHFSRSSSSSSGCWADVGAAMVLVMDVGLRV